MKPVNTSNKSLTDWERINALSDDEIDFSDIPEITPEMFKKAVVRKGLKTKSDQEKDNNSVNLKQ